MIRSPKNHPQPREGRGPIALARWALCLPLWIGCGGSAPTPSVVGAAHDHGEQVHAGESHTHDPAAAATTAVAEPGVGAVLDGADNPEDMQGESGYAWNLPVDRPQPVVPLDNPMTAEKVELGRHLFYDKRLSENGTQACASCHSQELGFAEQRKTSLGSTGELGARNAPGLANVAYFTSLTWVNPNLLTLEDQIAVPLFGDRPIELGVRDSDAMLERLRSDSRYPSWFAAAYPEQDEPITMTGTVHALASFLRSMIALDSPYDRFERGDRDALSESAQRGLNLFFGEALECHHCHNGFLFTNATRTATSVVQDLAFFNTGLYNLDGAGAYPDPTPGLIEFTNDAEDMGKFRTPSLRNVALTAPYLHDGSADTLEDVIRIYEAGGRHIEQGEFSGDGRQNPHKSGLVPGFELTDGERADLIAFLESLTDTSFIEDPRFSDPF